jgi:prepilin-type N-terminal cleavage/methylation domain-containing protein
MIKKYLKKRNNKGFTLVELMVSVSIFAIVLLICSGSILSVLDANRKSQSLRSVMDNLNSTLEGMTRNIRFGYAYHCGTGGSTASPQDCISGDSTFYMNGAQIIYRLNGSSIERSTNGGINYYKITSPDLVIQNLKFYVLGSTIYPDLNQPRVIISITGYVGVKQTTGSTFTLETTISQRKLDI